MMRCSLALLGRSLAPRRPLLFPALQLLPSHHAPVHSSTTARDAAKAYLEKHEISVSDSEAPGPVLSFDESGLPSNLIQQLGTSFTTPTPIQAQGLPIVMDGRNLVGIAQTGSGKTLAFLLPALVHIAQQREKGQVTGKFKGPNALILAPTRELAKQIEEVAVQFRRIAQIRTVCCIGGENRGRQLGHYDNGAQLMIGTPGRINDFLEAGEISLDNCSYVVLDEADRMLDMGFEPQVSSILQSVRPERQTVMFSATWPEEVQELASEFLGDYTFMNVGSVELSANKDIKQIVKVTPVDYRQEAFLTDMEGEMRGKKVLVFAERKATVDRIERMMRNRSIPAIGIHGDKSQAQRESTLRRFKDGSCRVMIATDVAARGLDISDVEYVVNYDFPNDIENYVHRIGRTGRANKKGTSITYMTPDDARHGNKLIKILVEAEQEVGQELRELAEKGRYAKKPVQTRQRGGSDRYGQRKQQFGQRSYSYRGLNEDDGEEEYRPRRQQGQRWDNNRNNGGGGGGYRHNRHPRDDSEW